MARFAKYFMIVILLQLPIFPLILPHSAEATGLVVENHSTARIKVSPTVNWGLGCLGAAGPLRDLRPGQSARFDFGLCTLERVRYCVDDSCARIHNFYATFPPKHGVGDWLHLDFISGRFGVPHWR